MLFNTLNSTDNTALQSLASSLAVPVDWLFALINFESGWNPAAINKKSNAAGLIQFLPSTARELGYTDSLDLIRQHPDIGGQLAGPVYRYLAKYRPYTTEQSLYMAVFYPAARYWNPEKEFPQIVMDYNPGITTVQSYVDKIKRGAGIIKPFTIIALVTLSFFLIHHFQKGGTEWEGQKAEQAAA